ncbi:MAG: ribosome silencing factor [Nannocystis sp.]|uniref:ribosome silencing factor n=1 Tax=Nannocystis sp. TaxID=1962667 RepID=UPI0024247A89|nr:ribosome silencing factor [Nannocystis sp.]MBK9755456.1 ribosome silencing factor [Nannocystis sp.]
MTKAELPALLQRALEIAIDAKAVGPVILHLTEVAGYTDYALIVSGRSDRHVGGITDALLAGLKAQGLSPIGSDGLDEHLWDLLDYDDFLIHIFYHPVRKHYDLESMWNDAPRVELDLPADVMDTSGLEGLTPPDPMPNFRGGSFGAFEGELDEDDPDLVGITGELDTNAVDAAVDADDDFDDEDEDEDDDFDDEDDADYDDDAPEAAVPDADDTIPPAPAGPARRK